MGSTRRGFLSGIAAAFGASLVPVAAWAKKQTSPIFLTTERAGEGDYRTAALTAEGVLRFELPLPGRAHGLAVDAIRQRAVVMARRPGTFAVVVDLARDAAGPTLAPPAGRVFEGHAVFSADGTRLYTCENDYDGERGVIGVWNATGNFQRLGEFASHGIEPHELLQLPNGLLVVANGGILTHPDTGRAKLNIPSMNPNLAYLDPSDGRLVARHEFADRRHRKLSIRHLAADNRGTLCIALQDQGPAGDRLPLVAFHRQGEVELTLVAAPPIIQRAMVGYAGSVAMEGHGEIAAVSAPRGDLVTFWSVATRRYLSHVEIDDGCAVSGTVIPGQFLITSGHGGAVLHDARRGVSRPIETPALTARSWDNHMVMAST